MSAVSTEIVTGAVPPPETQDGKATPDSQWYYLDESETSKGPISYAELQQKCNDNRNILVWNAYYTPQWVAFNTLSQMAAQPYPKEEWYILASLDAGGDSKSSDEKQPTDKSNKNENKTNNNTDDNSNADTPPKPTESDSAKSTTQIGPISKWDLVSRAHSKQITADTLVWLAGTPEWKPLRRFGELRGILDIVDSDAPMITLAVSTAQQSLTTTQIEEKQWYYKDEFGKDSGPLPFAELLFMVETDALHPKTQVREDGSECWKRIEDVQKTFSKELQKNRQNNDSIETESNGAVAADDDKSSSKSNGTNDSSGARQNDIASATTTSSVNVDTSVNSSDKSTKRIRKNRPKKRWKKVKNDTSVYITGLPNDITEEDVAEYFSKCGFLAKDLLSGDWKVRLYASDTAEQSLKGDGLVTYFRPESVPLAISMLDGTTIKPGYPITVQLAKFECHGAYKPSKRRKIDKAQRKVLHKMNNIESELSWDDNADNITPRLHIVILTSMFTLEQSRQSSHRTVDAFFTQLKDEIRAECTRIGTVDKITLFEDNSKGVVAVKFKHSKDARECIDVMNRRYFDGRIVDCFYWDGVTDYRVRETDEQEIERLQKFTEELESNQDPQQS